MKNTENVKILATQIPGNFFVKTWVRRVIGFNQGFPLDGSGFAGRVWS